MSRCLNKVMIIGNLGNDPALNHTKNGDPVSNFRVATNENWLKKDGSKVENTEWHRIVAWGNLAQICSQYFSKGDLVYIEGKLRTKRWEGKEGEVKYTTEIVANEVKLLNANNRKKEENTPEKSSEETEKSSEETEKISEEDDGLDF